MPLMSKSQQVNYGMATMTPYNYNSWLQCENSGNGMGSFGIMTYFTNKKENGYYYYDIYLLNNSYYKNGYVCSTYIKDIKVYTLINDKWYNVINFDYALVKPPSGNYDGFYHLSYVYNVNRISKIKVTWSEVTPY